jgi:hypothetical protein
MKVIQKLLGNGKWAAPSSKVKSVRVYLRGIRPITLSGADNRFFLISPQRGVRGAGSNANGALGDNTTTNRSTFTSISTVEQFYTVCASIGSGGHAIAYNKRLYGWGSNSFGELGDNTTTNRSTPTLVSTLFWNSIGTGPAGIAIDGKVYAWGANNTGRIGNNTTTNASSPVLSSTLPSSEFFKKVCTTGGGTSIALSKSNNAYVVGSGSFGELGLGDTVNRSSYAPIPSSFNNRVVDVAVGQFSSYLLLNNGSIYSTGYNLGGELGLGDTSFRSTFTLVPSSVKFTQLMSSSRVTGNFYAISTSGDVWACGSAQGIGNNPSVNRSTLTQVAGVSYAVAVAGGLSNALTDNFAGLSIGNIYLPYVYAWGANGFGQLGFNDTTNRSTPVQNASAPPVYDSAEDAILEERIVPVNYNQNYIYVTQASSATNAFQPSFGSVVFDPPTFDFEMFLEYYV